MPATWKTASLELKMQPSNARSAARLLGSGGCSVAVGSTGLVAMGPSPPKIMDTDRPDVAMQEHEPPIIDRDAAGLLPGQVRRPRHHLRPRRNDVDAVQLMLQQE